MTTMTRFVPFRSPLDGVAVLQNRLNSIFNDFAGSNGAAGGGAGLSLGSDGAETASGSALRFSASSIASIACVTGSEAELCCAI